MMIAFANCVVDRMNNDGLRRQRIRRSEGKLHRNAGAAADIDL